MSELFELIMSYPMQFLAGLGVSSATIYSCIKIIKFIVSFFRKNKTKLKEIAFINLVSDAVINKLKLDEIVNILKTEFNNTNSNLIAKVEDLKRILSELKDKSSCPVELIAYIETVLSQEGNEQLSLFYNQVKNNLNERENVKLLESKRENEQTEKTQNETQKQENNTETRQIEEKTPLIEEKSKTKKHKKKNRKVVTSDDEDISYA